MSVVRRDWTVAASSVTGYETPPMTTNIASSSVPDLRARQPMFKVLIVGGALAIAAAVVIAILAIRTGDNPGRAACQHIDELAQKDAKRWDRFVDALARTVVERAWNSA